VTRRGFMSMMLRPKPNPLSGCQKTSPRPKKARQVRSNVKVMLIVFSIMRELSVIYLYLVDRQWIRKTIWKYWKVYERQSGKKSLIHEGEKMDASQWKCIVVDAREILDKNESTVVPQPPYSPDLAPADFFLFPSSNPRRKDDYLSQLRRKKKICWRGCARLKNSMTVSKTGETRWEHCIKSGGEYFEGDKAD
jgi:hypothetical protein